jgi:dUTPase
MKIYIKNIEGISIPKRASEVAAGYDIVSTSDPKIVGKKDVPITHESKDVENSWLSIDYIEYETNLYIAPDAVTFHTLLHPRSSVSKYNLVLANSIGLIDNDYRGMVICRFKYIWQPEDLTIQTGVLSGKVNFNKIYKKGDTIAQLVIEPTVQAEWVIVDELKETNRGDGGFGSTDVKKTEFSKVSGKSLSDMYNQSGGIFIKEKYTEEVKKREVVI